jgi:hypothetical protein
LIESVVIDCETHALTPAAVEDRVMKNQTPTARKRRRRWLVAAVVITLMAAMGKIAAPIARAQVATPVFDVVSIKPNTSGDTRVTNKVQPGGRYAATNTRTSARLSV